MTTIQPHHHLAFGRAGAAGVKVQGPRRSQVMPMNTSPALPGNVRIDKILGVWPSKNSDFILDSIKSLRQRPRSHSHLRIKSNESKNNSHAALSKLQTTHTRALYQKDAIMNDIRVAQSASSGDHDLQIVRQYCYRIIWRSSHGMFEYHCLKNSRDETLLVDVTAFYDQNKTRMLVLLR